MAADEEILIEIKVDNDEAVRNINQQNEEINKLQKSQKELAAQGQKNSKRYQQNAQKIKELNTARRQNIKLISSEKGSLNQLRANLAKLTTERNKVNTTTKKGQAEFKRLNQAIKEQSDSIKEAEQSGGDFRRSVGDYKTALQGAIPSVDGFANSFRGFTTALMSNPIVAIITAIIAILAGLWEILKRTKVVTDLLNDAMTAIGSVFDSVGKILTGQMGLWDGLTGAIWGNAEAAVAAEQEQRRLKKAMADFSVGVARLSKEEERLQGIIGDSTLSFQEQNAALQKLALTQEILYRSKLGYAEQEVKLAEKQFELAKGTANEEEARQKLAEKRVALVEAQSDVEIKAMERAALQRQINQDIWEQELDFIIDVGEKQRDQFEEQATNEELSLAKRTEGLNKYKKAYTDFLNGQKAQFEKIGLSGEEIDSLLSIKDPQELAQAITDIKDLSEVEKNRLREVLIEFKNARAEQLKVQQDYDAIIKKNEDEAYNKEVQRGIEKAKIAEKRIEQEKKAKEAEQIRKEQEEVAADQAELKRLADLEKKKTDISKKNAKEREKIEEQVATAKAQLLTAGFNLAKTIAGENADLVKAIGLVEVGVNTARGIMQTFADITLPTPLKFLAAAKIAATGAAQAIAIGRAGSSTAVNNVPTSVGVAPNTSAADQNAQQTAALQQAIENIGLTVSVTEINDVQNQVQVTQQSATI